MEIVYFLVAGVLLYWGSDRLLNWIESLRGERLKYRDVVFFVIFLVSALVVFQILRQFGASAG